MVELYKLYALLSSFSVMCDGKPIQIEDIGQHIEEYEVNTFVIQQDEYYKVRFEGLFKSY